MRQALSATAFIKDRYGNQAQVLLHGKHLGEREREKAHRKIRLQPIKTGWQTRAVALQLSGWIIVLTTISESEVNGEETLDLYRLRWQIEIYFKRLKGLCRLGRIRAKRGSALAETDIFGRLFLALLLAAESGKKAMGRLEYLKSRPLASVSSGVVEVRPVKCFLSRCMPESSFAVRVAAVISDSGIIPFTSVIARRFVQQNRYGFYRREARVGVEFDFFELHPELRLLDHLSVHAHPAAGDVLFGLAT